MKIYKLLGYLLLGIGVYAVFNANTVKTQAIAFLIWTSLYPY
ncbi:MAG: hypothetical protein AAFN00_13420 [Cyanobacteria bacterium J06558_2]